MSEKIVQLNEEVINGQNKELVRGSAEEALNELLEADGVKLIIVDKRLGMLEAVGKVYPGANYRRCTVHFYGTFSLSFPDPG